MTLETFGPVDGRSQLLRETLRTTQPAQGLREQGAIQPRDTGLCPQTPSRYCLSSP